MRVRTLHLRNFLQHKDCSIAFADDIRLSVIAGPTGAGKTSVADAIRVLLTGTSRGVARKDRHLLGRGQDPWRIEAEIHNGAGKWSCLAGPTTQTPTTGEIQTALGPSRLLEALTDWQVWPGMALEERQKLLFAIGGAHSKTDPRLPADIDEIRKSRGVNAAANKAVEKRREVQRLIGELSAAMPAPKHKVVIAEEEHDLKGMDRAEIDRRVTTAKQRLDAAVKRQQMAGAASGPHRAELERIVAVAPKAATLEAAKEQLGRANLQMEAGLAGIARNQVAREQLERQRERLRTVGEQDACPVHDAVRCPVWGDVRGGLDRRRATIEAERKRLNEELAHLEEDLVQVREVHAEAAAQHREAEDLQRRAATAHQELVRLRAMQREAEQMGLDPVEAESEVQVASARLSAAQQLSYALGHYDAEMQRRTDTEGKIQRWRQEIQALQAAEDVLRLMLRDGAGDASAALTLAVTELAKAWGFTYALDETLLPRLDGRPYGLLSRAERYRGAVIVQAALARVSAVEWFVADDLDILMPTDRRGFQAWALNIGADQVIACVSQERPADAKMGQIEVLALVGWQAGHARKESEQ